MENLNEKDHSPLASLDVWEDDVLQRYPEEGPAKK
jgi:inositol oxygenase